MTSLNRVPKKENRDAWNEDLATCGRSKRLAYVLAWVLAIGLAGGIFYSVWSLKAELLYKGCFLMAIGIMFIAIDLLAKWLARKFVAHER
jgi:hypothetical protein